MAKIPEYADAVYRFVQAHATIEDGQRVCREPLYPWLMEEFGLNIHDVKAIRTSAVKELERRGLVQRPNPRVALLILID
ncbi:hypothetical protein GA0070558_1034 [Micromonospora haikouensis]|uniref:Uncharacterized protein n=1 Tax=Micromonospora haikouensis TaxID=686309 RepID=A0A1C4UBV6_9ACTN|nr:hypothetical protein [Micromonospora haikouensis]SCE69109.1 hypothetical protein GA0070558_1034 [Micromonospora haikouensis]